MTTNPKTIATRRPAETGTATLGGLAAALAAALDLSAEWTTVLLIAVALVPAVITWAVNARRAR